MLLPTMERVSLEQLKEIIKGRQIRLIVPLKEKAITVSVEEKDLIEQLTQQEAKEITVDAYPSTVYIFTFTI